VRGGWRTLVGTMMKARGHIYAAHEILWKPSDEGLTAHFNWVPLYFFENRTGKLRFLPHDFAVYGDDLVPNGWLVTCGEGLLEACSVLYLWKVLSVQLWAQYCENQSAPAIKGKTKAPFQSKAWNAMKEMLGDVLAGGSILMGEGDDAEKLDLALSGQLPYPELRKAMVDAMAVLWRGGSMGTTGSNQGTEQHGVKLQGDEEYKLQCDDAELVTETLQEQIDPLVIGWAFGDGTHPMAHVVVQPPPQQDTDNDIKRYTFVMGAGVQVGKRQLGTQFGIAEMDEDDEPAEVMQPTAPGGMGGDPLGKDKKETFSQNERYAANVEANLLRSGLDMLAKGTADAFKPVRERLAAVLALPEGEQKAALRQFVNDAPDILEQINKDPANADALYRLQTAAWWNGLLEAKRR
jgi:hypothetical protein